MRWSRLKSLTGLLLAGFALVSVPLLLAVVMSATKIRCLAAQSANLVRSGVERTYYSDQLLEGILRFEPSVKAYGASNGEEVERSYQRSRANLFDTLAALDHIAKDTGRAQLVQGLRDALRDVDVVLSRSLPTGARETALTQVNSMRRLAAQLSRTNGEQIETGLQRLQKSSSDAQQFLLWQSVCLTAVTAGLVAWFTVLSLRRVRRIEGAHPPAG